jgi:hypothetical protein
MFQSPDGDCFIFYIPVPWPANRRSTPIATRFSPLTGIVLFSTGSQSQEEKMKAYKSFSPLTGIVLFSTTWFDQRPSYKPKPGFSPLTGIVLFSTPSG